MKKLLTTLAAMLTLLVMPAQAADIKLKQNLTTTKNITIQSPGTLSVAGAVTLTTPLTAANIQTGSAKRELLRASLSPNTGAAADSTVYKVLLFPGRACTVKRIQFGSQVAPIGGIDTIKVLKSTSSGNTLLNSATFDATTLVNNVATNATLTSTGADLALTATQGIYCEYSAGVQITDAVDLSVTAEIEPDNF